VTPRGRAALVLGLVLIAAAMLAATVTVHAGLHDCGSSLSAHAPQEKFSSKSNESVAEDRCDRKITDRRVYVAAIGGMGLLFAMGGAYDHKRS
jgi:hypothetical protein